jgi:hypothetical protein
VLVAGSLAAVVRHLCSGIGLPASTASAVMAETTVAGLLRTLDALPESAAAQALAERIRGWRNHSVARYLVDSHACPLLPKFVYFGECDFMPGQGVDPRSDPQAGRQRPHPGRARPAQPAGDGRGQARGHVPAGRHERHIRELENAGNVISDEVSGWTRSKDLGISVTVLQPEAGAVPPLDEGPVLQIRVDNRRRRISVPLSEQPAGFAWLFSFLAYLTELEVARPARLVLLLDQPGLSLHACAHENLQRVIEDHLAPRQQVVYTTGSPFI